MKISLRQIGLLCAIAGAMFAVQASAAVKLSRVMNGPYYSTDEAGRGASVLVTERPDGSKNFFAALYSYGPDGEPIWLILQADFLEHQFENTEVPILLFAGGTFGFPFTDPEFEQVGTATVRVNSCDSIFFDLDMDESSGLPDVTLGDLRLLGGPAGYCAYTREFDGCPDFAEAFAAIPRACELNGVYTEDIDLTNEITWVLNGLVRVGDDNANSATITVEPGTVLIGAGQAADYLYISPGSKIFANGTPHAPIVMTSPQDGFSVEFGNPQPGDVGGLVISGNAPSNNCPNAPFNCFSEFDETLRFGGDDPHESSGEISYWQVRYAGYIFAPNREVNSFTFQAVGDGTKAHHLQAFRGQDDGVEFFGGTVNLNYFVVTEGGDDAVDWDLGYSGKLQYGLVWHGEGFGEDFGIEGASNPDGFDALPRATPTVANYTFMGNMNGDAGILFKEGSGGRIYNTIVYGFADGCLEMADAPATYDAAGTPANPNTDNTAYNGVIVMCDDNFISDAAAAYTVEEFFNSDAFENNEEADPELDGYMPMPGSRSLMDSVIIDDGYFDYTFYRGAFDGVNDWTSIWTHQVTGGQ